MWHSFKIMAGASVLAGVCMLGAWATPAAAARQVGLRSVPHGEVRPAPYWRWANGCRGGRYYRYLGGWGCDYYAYSGYPRPRR
jgi:hypothetical protein